MARTMLRALRVTPELSLPPPRAAEAVAVRKRAETEAVPVVLPPAPTAFAMQVGGGVRVGGPAADAAAMGSVAILWRPDGLGAAVTANLAPRGDIRSTAFTGTIRDDAIALTARLPIALVDRLDLVPELGAALHVMSLEGIQSADGASSSSSRVDPAIRGGLAATYGIGAFEIGLGVTLDWLVRRQAYEVGTTEVLQIRMFQISVGLGLMARFL